MSVEIVRLFKRHTHRLRLQTTCFSTKHPSFSFLAFSFSTHTLSLLLDVLSLVNHHSLSLYFILCSTLSKYADALLLVPALQPEPLVDPKSPSHSVPRRVISSGTGPSIAVVIASRIPHTSSPHTTPFETPSIIQDYDPLFSILPCTYLRFGDIRFAICWG